MKSLLKSATKKTFVDPVKSTRDAFAAILSSQDHKAPEKTLDEATRGLGQIKFILYGDAEIYPNQDTVARTTKDIFAEDFFRLLIKAVPYLSNDARTDAAQIVGNLQRQLVNSRNIACDYLLSNTDLLDLLVRSYVDASVALIYGSMLRDCIRHQVIAKYVLNSPDFPKFFEYIELPNFDISTDAAATLKELLTRHKSTAAEFLNNNYDSFFNRYVKLLQSPNYITRRMAIKMLADILLDRSNVKIMLRFVSSTDNLRLMMNLLKDPSQSIQLEAFHIFKVFVANVQNPGEILNILLSNREKLLRFLDAFTLDKEDKVFEQDKAQVLKEIQELQPVE